MRDLKNPKKNKLNYSLMKFVDCYTQKTNMVLDLGNLLFPFFCWFVPFFEIWPLFTGNYDKYVLLTDSKLITPLVIGYH